MTQQDLKKLQLVELDILKKIDSVCTKNNIRYYMVGGTLLGAVRHNGFIPWDDDLDIAMPREDYNRFLNLCIHGELGSDYFLHHQITDKGYWAPFAKIRKNNTLFDEQLCKNVNCNKGIFVDIFPLDFCRNEKSVWYHIKAKIIKKLNLIMYCRGLYLKINGFHNIVLLNISKLISIKKLSEIIDKLSSSCRAGNYYINYGSNYKYTKQTMPIDIYDPAVRIKFEDGYFYAPNQYIKYLERIFKNWKELPPKEKRRNHNPARIIFDVAREG